MPAAPRLESAVPSEGCLDSSERIRPTTDVLTWGGDVSGPVNHGESVCFERRNIEVYRTDYNEVRPHSFLDSRTPN